MISNYILFSHLSCVAVFVKYFFLVFGILVMVFFVMVSNLVTVLL